MSLACLLQCNPIEVSTFSFPSCGLQCFRPDFIPKTGLKMSVSNLKENADVKGVFYIKENNHQIAGFISKINRHSPIEHIIDATFSS